MQPKTYRKMVEEGGVLWEYIPAPLGETSVAFYSDNFPNLNLTFSQALYILLQKADSMMGKLIAEGVSPETIAKEYEMQFTVDDGGWEHFSDQAIKLERRIGMVALRFVRRKPGALIMPRQKKYEP